MAVERLETHHFMDQQDFFSASYPKEEEKEDAGDDRCSSDTQEVNKKKKKILVLGGTAFIGRTVVESLAAGGYSLVLLNRGRSYWDGKHVENAEYIQADRRDSTAFSKCIDTLTQKEVEEGRESWLAVVDFSAYKPTEMQASLDGLQGRFDMYIYISSDSVYEVCDSELWKDSPFVDESHAVRPADEARVRILRKKDTYGHVRTPHFSEVPPLSKSRP
ncbi:nad dependent epimerase dehydratase family protein [Cystoisospora suis]|uniref:Nad dependent epimerase dehydratase family protein n=1 Tax=Cystoisospora suis TaxID=483139 RepID=A0A2C6LAM6_9APIC|nr:nad dependent epimerase dehydratase family protein [Cystoisospora suis]